MSLSGRVIGLLEDDPIMGESLVQRLALEGTIVHWWKCGEEALAQLPHERPEAVVCDIRLPDMSGEDVFRQVAANGVTPPFLFITGFGDIDHAVGLIRAGASDYLTKPFEMHDFLDRLQAVLREPIRTDGTVLGSSPQMQTIAKTLDRLARLKTPVLFTGETGVGKEVSARYLHQAQDAALPFVAVNCAAIPSELLEAELFGHEKGAFTGAHAKHTGYAERAGNGTLFLDEIGELPLAMQSKLLRLLEQRQFSRVGGEKAINFEARIVCATNAKLDKRVKEGTFREDLLYRINVISIEIPPLRERPADVAALLDTYFDSFNETFDTGLRGISAIAEDAAIAHDWPGNVRELRNRLERAVAMSMGPWVMPADLFPEKAAAVVEAKELPSLGEARDDAERRHIQRALAITENEMGQAAKVLGISRTTLWEKMRRLGISTDTE